MHTVAATEHSAKSTDAVAVASDDQSTGCICCGNDITNGCAATNRCCRLVRCNSDCVETRKVNENTPFAQVESLGPPNTAILSKKWYAFFRTVFNL